MKIYLLLIITLSFISFGCASSKIYVDADEVSGVGAVVEFPTGKIIPIEIKEVVSGNTIRLTNKEEVVLIGTYIPNIYNIREAAKAFTKNIVTKNEIRFEFDKQQRDSKRRLLAYVFTTDGQLINAELIREGLAQALMAPGNTKHQDRLLKAEADAREKKRGLWSDEFKKNR
ncbi:MAG: thermonuclease family protein [Candidatus Omnitrophica bacterium]|nr:thermonuclease family protein [Candidatus Omnitrophota bacterium]